MSPRGYRGADREEKGVTEMSRTRIWIVLAFASLLAVGLLAAGCGGDDDDDEVAGGGEDLGLIKEGQLLVGTDTPFPPFEIGQPPDNFSGYDPDTFNEVANRINLDVEYQDTSFDTIFRDTAQGKFDLAVAASTITEGRERTVDFSDPYYRANQALTVPEDSDIQTVDDLGGATVGAQDATTGEAYVQDETDASEVRGYPEGPDALNALRAGQVDAVVIDEPVAEDAIKKFGDLEITQIPTGELYGFAFAEDSDALREQVNEALAEMKDDGTIDQLYEKYFKTKPPSEVLEGTHEPS
jgi:polar amino acid transport system substrate-binding protein